MGRSQCRTIGEAIKKAQPGTCILVRPGLYLESLVLNQPVEILGDGPLKDIIIQSTDSSCILMQTDCALVRGLTLRGSAAQEGKRFFAVDIPQGQLVLEDCDITSDSFSCVGIHGSMAKPIIRRCQIRDGKGSGVWVKENGQGTVEDCDIFGNNYAGVGIREGGNPVLRKCQIHNGKGRGVFVYENGEGTVEDCDIFGNKFSGVEIREGGNPVIQRCRITQNKSYAIYVHSKGKGTVENCDLTGNDRGAFNIGLTCSVSRSGNKT